MLVDSEEEYTTSEKAKLKADLTKRGLSLIVFAEWYHVGVMKQMRFFDDNTHSYWTPPTGGANVPALNELLEPFGVAFAEDALAGNLMAPGGAFSVASGTSLLKFPAGGYVHRAERLTDQSVNFHGGHRRRLEDAADSVPMIGLLNLEGTRPGRLFAYGDSSCLDSAHQSSNCFFLLERVLKWAAEGVKDGDLLSDSVKLSSALSVRPSAEPPRRVSATAQPARSLSTAALTCTAGLCGITECTLGVRFLACAGAGHQGADEADRHRPERDEPSARENSPGAPAHRCAAVHRTRPVRQSGRVKLTHQWRLCSALFLCSAGSTLRRNSGRWSSRGSMR